MGFFSNNNMPKAGEAESTSSFLKVGIHKVHFTEVKIISGSKNGKDWKAVKFTVADDNNAVNTFSFFSPMVDDDNERHEYSYTNKKGEPEKRTYPSRTEVLMYAMRHMIDAVNPQAGIDYDNQPIDFDSFEEMIGYWQKTVFDDAIKNKKNVYIKLIPQKENLKFCSIPDSWLAAPQPNDKVKSTHCHVNNNWMVKETEKEKLSFSEWEMGKIEEAKKVPDMISASSNNEANDSVTAVENKIDSKIPTTNQIDNDDLPF